MSILKLKNKNDEHLNAKKSQKTNHDNKFDMVYNEANEDNGVNCEKIIVNTMFDAGSIDVIDISDVNNLHFKLKGDTKSSFAQWFYFQLSNVADQNLSITINDLKNSAYPDGWNEYNVCVSYDNNYWFRLPTSFDGDKLWFSLTPLCNTVYFAYFEPYSYQRHLELISEINEDANVRHQVLGQTIEGRNIDLLILGNPKAKHKIWIIARQHPGETMAEWFMEGVLNRLVNPHDSISRALLDDCVFYCVPNMNPDGSCHGNLRVNSVGINLNREWLTPTIKKSPEVFYVRQKMLETGVDMFFDIHGDEAIPYVFTASCSDNPSFSAKQKKLSDAFVKYFPLIKDRKSVV